jgi:beta-glucosidase
LGLFEKPYPDREAIKKLFHRKEDDEFSYLLARESMTLLKNSDNMLPLSKNISTLI